ncbi:MULTISPECIES: DUF4192 domain-containing protein [unclassified Streptomyces]|uniref:DUF4192 domain-containing protein n=1 Tax=unclassified Streptomyces TaxID=2593676 RepID=UPI0013164ECD|nr:MULTISPECIES: DUF4192 domain-containing protein [unclassified Streptomyces]QHC31754.1 DUF4192 family protein [Streptomyces sp. HF10]WKE69274.1 DUF4192 domain-containing protein [Streptomyces sp. WP-1]
MTNHSETTAQVTLRTPAELADALPYLLGYRPEDSMVLVALHDSGGKGRFGGRARLGIPAHEEDWEEAARQLARGLVTSSERRGAKPEQLVAYVCQEPAPGEHGRDVKRRLARLAHLLRIQCGDLDVPVIEALCISDGRYWSYCCPVEDCCPEDGTPMGLPGTSVLAAAATYAGMQVRGTLKELRARLQPWEAAAAREQEAALDAGGLALVPRILDETGRAEVAEETIVLAERVIHRLAATTPVAGALPADLRDDGLIGHDEAARLILGLQDRDTRDRAAAWMEGDEAAPALRLWRALARRCVGPYAEHAAPPLTLAGWVAWSTGDELEAREALAMALGADPDYLFARLLHQACNEGVDVESVRRCLRAGRAGGAPGTERAQEGGALPADASATTASVATGPTKCAENVAGPTPAGESDPAARIRRRRRLRSALAAAGDGPRAARVPGPRRRPTVPAPAAGRAPRAGTRHPAGTRMPTKGTGESMT